MAITEDSLILDVLHSAMGFRNLLREDEVKCSHFLHLEILWDHFYHEVNKLECGQNFILSRIVRVTIYVGTVLSDPSLSQECQDLKDRND